MLSPVSEVGTVNSAVYPKGFLTPTIIMLASTGTKLVWRRLRKVTKRPPKITECWKRETIHEVRGQGCVQQTEV
jgi:hypothetical protein